MSVRTAMLTTVIIIIIIIIIINSWPLNLTRAHGKDSLLCIKQCKNEHINNNNNNNNITA
jgi:hypothetical protein